MINQKITLTDPKSGEYFYQEAMKTLRTNLQFSGKHHRAIMLTSAHSGEGKSDICFHLAVEMGKAGKKVLLIDADIRKSVYLSRYNIPGKTKGLSEYLSGQVEHLDELIYMTNYENLHMILAGPYAPNPTEMLGDAQFAELVKAARQVYDYVFVDTPPLGDIIDAAVVGQHCDGAVMVIESGAVSYRISQKIKNQLEKSGCKWLGVVINKVDTRADRYYGSKYGKYGKYYGKEE
ncbi:MAG: CpsD/CapB family tyrosine-protein kinase [Erysipelotrichaceae bacterium]|nr:CpsD/CapB family tyrosine-protein kinase [Erysipelotrichaceae bacterium]